MKWLFSIAFVFATSMPSLADEPPKFDCTTDAATWTREQTFYCLARELEELDRLIRGIEDSVDRMPKEDRLPTEDELIKGINDAIRKGAGQ